MIYTFTYQRALNFGATLQAYALAKFLNDNELPTQVVDYLPPYMHWQTKRPMKSLKGSIEKYKKYRKFSAFRRQFMPLTPKTFYSRNGLKRLVNPSAFVVGSDQVWNPNLHGESRDKKTGKANFDMTYLFDFPLPEASQTRVKKVAYAASAGSVRFRDITNRQIQDAISGFDAIGCRERILEQDVKVSLDESNACNSTKPQTDTVLDPSLLLRDYSEIELNHLVPKHDYVVSYVVGSGDMLSTFEKRVSEAKHLFGLPVIHLGAKAIASADQNVLDIGPREWLTYIKNAKYVITNSFHGCAFSLNFNRQFTLIPHKLTELNQRQKTLLEGVGLSERLLADGEAISEENCRPIDFNEVNKNLDALIRHSQRFLIEALQSN
ncbi:polysaccharide pyruvyl transferase family protein [Psychrosphaera ytuae]|uniref:Polysaccharide pyruvyl transferase family protein n=1 Tax=Psychrosphaera ytuae TaxID=2820710 RepID=A0A975DCG9_9GAMM|nr:polysaccharide pyruvyl transferase family protein [Psychrosphaera ytuae]QTH64612.1 polysaccharide pyruvyl transferase family protein [Psychrosphaera ytuae]